MARATIKKSTNLNLRIFRKLKKKSKRPFEINHAIENALAQKKLREIIEKVRRTRVFSRSFY